MVRQPASVPTRTSLRLGRLAPRPAADEGAPSLLLALPPETLDLIFTFAVPPGVPSRKRRSQLARFLLIHPVLTPIVRRKLYHKVTLVVGDPDGSDQRLLKLVKRDSSLGREVKFVKVRVPDPEPDRTTEADLTRDPALSILPAARLDQRETVRLVADFFDAIDGLRHLEIDARVGTRVEGGSNGGGPNDDDDDEEYGEEYGGREQLARLETTMRGWALTLETFIFQLADPYQRLQVFADATIGYQSPFVGALASWSSLTFVDLWRVRLKLPSDLARAQFKLKILRLRDVEFTSSFELAWLINDSNVLARLVLQDPVFTSTPASSSPLTEIFTTKTVPAFAQSLRELRLGLLHPLGAPSPNHVLSPFSRLETLHLGGAGIDLPLFASVFPPLANSLGSSTSNARGHGFPSERLESLTLYYLVHPSLVSSGYDASPLDVASDSFHTTLFAHLATPRAVPRLRSLSLQPTGDFARTVSWSERRGVPLPLWRLSRNSTSEQDEADAWIGLESPLRYVNRQRRRENLQRGGGDGRDEIGPIRLYKNWAEIDYADDASDGDDDDDDAGEEEFDGDALFEPSSDDDAPIVNGPATRREPDTDDSDF